MDSGAIIIRPAVWNDLEALVSLLQDLFAIEEDFEPHPEHQRRGLQLFLDGCGKHRSILVAEMEEEVVAMATIQILISTARGSRVGLIEDVVVRQDRRGIGIGRRLLNAVASWAAAHGLTRLQLLADRSNRPALNFYRKRGWESTQLICLRKNDMTVSKPDDRSKPGY